jgi:hypothetical protein
VCLALARCAVIIDGHCSQVAIHSTVAETRVLELSFTYPNQKIQEKPGLVLVRRCGILGPRDILVAIGVHAEKEVIQ